MFFLLICIYLCASKLATTLKSIIMMMKRLKRAQAIAVILLCGLFCAQCSNEDPSNEILFNNYQEYAAPQNDVMHVTCGLKSYVFPGSYEGVQEAIVNRLTNQVSECNNDAQVIVLDGNKMASLTADEASNILKAYLNNAALIMMRPSHEQWEAFSTAMRTAALGLDETNYQDNQNFEYAYTVIAHLYEEFELLGDVFELEQETAKLPFNAIGICGMDVVHMDKTIPQDLALEFELTDENGEVIVEHFEPNEMQLSEYEKGLQAELLIKWVNTKVQGLEDNLMEREEAARSLSRAADTPSLQELTGGQTDTQIGYFQVYPEFGCDFTIDRRVWSCYSPDEDADYFMVNQKVYLFASKLNCGPDNSKKEWRFIKKEELKKWYGQSSRSYYIYGPYISEVKTENFFTDGKESKATKKKDKKDTFTKLSGVEVIDWSPQNSSTGDVQQPVGLDVSINAKKAFNVISTGPKPNSLSGVVSIKLHGSWGTTVPKFSTQVVAADGTATWTHKSPQVKYDRIPTINGNYEYNHGIAAESQKTDQIYSHSWIFRVKNPTRASYAMMQKIELKGQFITYDSGISSGIGSPRPSVITNAAYGSNKISLNKAMTVIAPPRATQEWDIYGEVTQNDSKYSDTEFDRFMEEDLLRRFGSYGYGQLIIDTSTADDLTKVDYCWDEFIAALNNNLSYFKSKHMYGKYKFYLKQQDSDTPYKEYDFEVSKP